jgi:RimJ/RimL family protein N-acetyltransferase
MTDRRSSCELWLAAATELEYVYQTERMPGYESLVARWSLEAHYLARARPDTRYLIGGRQIGAAEGFVILQPLADAHEGTKIKRIAVTAPGNGFGQALLDATFRWVFTRTASHRVWLDVLAHNGRAIAAYEAAGMTLEGRLRASYEMEGGGHVDRLVLSILREEWYGRAETC